MPLREATAPTSVPGEPDNFVLLGQYFTLQHLVAVDDVSSTLLYLNPFGKLFKFRSETLQTRIGIFCLLRYFQFVFIISPVSNEL